VSDGISLTDLAAQLNLAKSTVSHRVKNGIRGDWIRNLETRKGHPARLVRGAPLPEIRPALPTVDDVRQALDSRTPVEHPKTPVLPTLSRSRSSVRPDSAWRKL